MALESFEPAGLVYKLVEALPVVDEKVVACRQGLVVVSEMVVLEMVSGGAHFALELLCRAVVVAVSQEGLQQL